MNNEFAQRVESLVVDKWFSNPPKLIDTMSNKPSVGVTRAFVLQWTKFSRLFPRWVGSIMSNCPEFEVLAYEVENLMSEVVLDPAVDTNHYQLLIRLGNGVGLSREEIENFPTLEAATSTFDWLWTKARDPDWLVGFTAVNGLEILGDRNLPGKYHLKAGTGLDPDPYSKHLGLSQDATQFFEVSDKADAGHGHETVRIIADYTPEQRQNEILQILDESMQRLRFMMDSMWELSKELEGD